MRKVPTLGLIVVGAALAVSASAKPEPAVAGAQSSSVPSTSSSPPAKERGDLEGAEAAWDRAKNAALRPTAFDWLRLSERSRGDDGGALEGPERQDVRSHVAA
jgi:hypothetical protein